MGGLVKPPTVAFTVDGANKTMTTVYQAATDGFVVASISKGGVYSISIAGFTDGANPPTTQVGSNTAYSAGASGTRYASVTFPVKKNDYYKVTMNPVDCTVIFYRFYSMG